jgi:hypothetical protein
LALTKLECALLLLPCRKLIFAVPHDNAPLLG